MNKFDFHTHILPSIDDGSSNVKMSIDMINKLGGQGVKKILLTPHFYSYRISIEDFTKKRADAFERLKSKLPENSPELILASETYLTDYIFNYDDISSILIENTRYLLLELSYSEKIDDKTVNKISSLISKYNIIPIIAHVERFNKVFNNIKLYDQLLNMGCLFQVNLYSLKDNFFLKRKILKYIENGYIHVLGTDCHNLEVRPPKYDEYFKIIYSNIEKKYLDRLSSNAEKILNNELI